MLCLIYLGLNHFMEPPAAVVVAAVFVGDSVLAPLLGKAVGRHHYQMPLAQQKTMEGSLLGVFLGTCIGSYVFLVLMGLELPPLRNMLVYGLLAAVGEATSPGHWDNVAIFCMLLISWHRVQQLLPSISSSSSDVIAEDVS
jgi:dolichol kinase